MIKSSYSYATPDDHPILSSREYNENIGTIRSQFDRDRDRILHSKAFKRLSHKSQVFISQRGDHHRSRLTHTLEVESISHSIASTLELNVSLCSAIALAHDLGATPFGKSGENSLRLIMEENSLQGFRHNHQGIRVIEQLESQYPDYPGLNLTLAVKEGILKHRDVDESSLILHSNHLINFVQTTDISIPSTLEAQAVRISDEIAQIYHYLEDGLRYNLISEIEIWESSLWDECRKFIEDAYHVSFKEFIGEIDYERNGKDVKKLTTCRFLIKFMVTRVIQNSKKLIINSGKDKIRPGEIKNVFLDFDPLTSKNVNEFFQQVIVPHIINHNYLIITYRKCEDIVNKMFESFRLYPQQMPAKTYLLYDRAKKQEGNVELRIIADHISGMTDRHALKIYKDLFNADHILFPE